MARKAEYTGLGGPLQRNGHAVNGSGGLVDREAGGPAAPDIDRDIFRDVLVLDLTRSHVAEHYTVYVSSSDNVIKTSQTLQGYPRAGNADEGLVAVAHDQFDTIDASAVGSGWLAMNHDYFITEPRVLRDLIEILRWGNRDPSAYGRLMKPRDDSPGAPWVLGADEAPAESATAAHP